jgi:hypothetical protein
MQDFLLTQRTLNLSNISDGQVNGKCYATVRAVNIYRMDSEMNASRTI